MNRLFFSALSIAPLFGTNLQAARAGHLTCSFQSFAVLLHGVGQNTVR
jgi:hypothetical protein